MPDRGLRTIDGLAPAAFEAGPLELASARWLQATFEVDRDAALHWMPTDVTRPIPCYARLLVVEGETSAGRLRFAALGVGGRFRMMPRNALVEAIVDGSTGVPALSGPTRPGQVAIARDGTDVIARVASAEGLLADLRLPAPYAIDPALLRWDGWVVFAPGGDGTVLAEAPVVVDASAAWLSKGASVAPGQGLERSSPWWQLRSLLPISACVVEGRLRIGPAAVPAPALMG
jgi:hypothetical protein